MAKNQIKKTYEFCPLWKRLVYRYARVAVAAFIAILIAYFVPEFKDEMMVVLTAAFVTLDKLVRERSV